MAVVLPEPFGPSSPKISPSSMSSAGGQALTDHRNVLQDFLYVQA